MANHSHHFVCQNVLSGVHDCCRSQKYNRYLREGFSLILQEISSQFKSKDYLQTHGTVMVKKMGEVFADNFLAKIENIIFRQS